jgi:phosphoserine aminotransferase
MYSFHPGPSEVFPHVRTYLTDAYDQGILSLPHRHPDFSAMYRRIRELMRERFNLPPDYCLYFFSSATECWSVVSEGMVEDSALHVFTGNFGRRWYEYSYTINGRVARLDLEPDQDYFELTDDQFQGYEMVCLTHNETSNGSQVPIEYLHHLRQRLPESILAVDATSSLAGVNLPLEAADIWFASVQKCFGLPAGLAVMFCSPRAVQVFQRLNFDDQYNCLVFTHQNALKFQTTHTPNVLNIYLLLRVLESSPTIAQIHDRLVERSTRLYQVLDQHSHFRALIRLRANRSITVVAVQGVMQDIAHFRQQLAEQGIRIGTGYGEWADTTFRLANFPAHSDETYHQMIDLIRSFPTAN